ncbi:lamin tail domain-containing protein [Myxococcota bacterium]
MNDRWMSPGLVTSRRERVAVMGRRAYVGLWLSAGMALASCGSHEMSSGMVGLTGASVFINEVGARNTVAQDNYEDTPDWIELYNAGKRDVSLAGYYISDNGDNLLKAELSPEAVVPAGGVLVLWGRVDSAEETDPLHLPFGLSGDGEGVWLSDPQGRLLDHVEFGAGEQDHSYGRYPDGTGEFRWCAIPTPKEVNGDRCIATEL